jgi:hypothetical protein
MITILDVAVAWGARKDERGCISGGEFERLGLPLFGGCQTCGASIAAYNAVPNKNGYLSCKGGCAPCPYSTVEEFEADYPRESAPSADECPDAGENLGSRIASRFESAESPEDLRRAVVWMLDHVEERCDFRHAAEGGDPDDERAPWYRLARLANRLAEQAARSPLPGIEEGA